MSSSKRPGHLIRALIPTGVAACLASGLVAALPCRAASAPPHIEFFTGEGAAKARATARYYGDLTTVQVSALIPGAVYTLRLRLKLAPEKRQGERSYDAHVDARAGADGTIDTGTAAPLAGTYSRPDPDGLFWSAKAVAPTPGPDSTCRLTVESQGHVLAEATLPFAYTRPGVRRIELTGTGLVGTLFLPEASGTKAVRRPAVLTLSGSGGGRAAPAASALANAGFVTLGLAYFGEPGVPARLANIPLEYFGKAIAYLAARPEVAPGQIAVMGASRGGELALLLGATFPNLRAVIAKVPSPLRWDAEGDYLSTARRPASWTLGGVPLPYLPSGVMIQTARVGGREVYAWRPGYEKEMSNTANDVASAWTAVEKTNGPILMLGGEDDQEWPSCPFVRMALARLKETHHAFSDAAVCYSGAGHAVTMVPGLPTTSRYWEMADLQLLVDDGGTPAADAAGQRDGWIRSLALLRATFPAAPAAAH